MKQLQNSQPFAVSTTFRPLNTAMKIVVLGGMSVMQFYRQATQEWMPDHTKVPVIDAGGAQSDGYLRLQAQYTIDNPEGGLSVATIVPQIYWYVDDTQIVSTDTTADYFIADNVLCVRKNFTHLNGVTVYCEVRFTDTRTSSPQVLSDTLSLSAVLQGDEQWAINILCDRTRKHHPLFAASTIYSFEAEARFGSVDKTADVAWFWDYSTDNGATWNTIYGAGDYDEGTMTELDFYSNKFCPWYVSGKNASTLSVDADYIEQLMVRCRIATEDLATATAPNLPNLATASLAWRWPHLQPVTFSYGGNKVFTETQFMTFGLIVHIAKHNDMTSDQQRHWLIPNWVIRKQGSLDTATRLSAGGLEVTIPAYELFNTSGIKYIIDPQLSIRGTYDLLADPEGEIFQLSTGDTMAIRI